jgi:hypothetical protein
LRARAAGALAPALLAAACGGGPEGYGGILRTPLQEAIAAHDVARVRELTAAHAALGKSVTLQWTAWYLALLETRESDPRTVEIVALVLDAVAAEERTSPAAVVNRDIVIPRTGRRSGAPTLHPPVAVVSLNRSIAGLRLLVDKGLDARSPGALAAYAEALTSDCTKCVAVLLDAGTPVDTLDLHGKAPLQGARDGLYPDLAALLSSRGASGRVGPEATAEQATLRVNGRATGGRQETWIEGAAIAEHPAGRTVLQLAAQGEPGFPSADAVRAGFAAGSVLLTHGPETEIQLVRFPHDDPRPGARTTVMELRVRPRADGGATVAYDH